MIFLAPLTGLIAAAITVPTLLAFYLLRLRRRPVRVSTTMFWLPVGEDLEANVPLRMLRASWLLLLHLMLLASLLLAVARPALPGGAPADTVFIVLDLTASMRATDTEDGRTRLEIAKDEAIGFIDDLGSQGFPGRVAVIGVGADARLLARPEPGLGRARSVIRDAEPTDQPGDIRSAVPIIEGYAERAVRDESETPPALAARFFTDHGFAPEIPGVKTGVAEEPKSDGTPNAGVVALAARRDRADPAVIRVFARLIWTGAQEREAVVRLTAETESAPIDDARAVRLEPASGASAGGASAGFEVRSVGAALVTVSLRDGGSLGSDDSASIAVPPVRRPRIVLVREQTDEIGPASWMLETVLSETEPRSLAVRAPAGFAASEGDLFVFDGVEPPRGFGAPTLVFGGPPPVGGVTLAGGTESGSPAAWDRGHPVMREVGVGSLRVVDAPAFGIVGARLRTEELMRGDLGPWAVLVRAPGAEHIAVSFDLAQSNWPLQVSMPIFIANAVERLTGAGPAQGRVFRTDEPIDLEGLGAESISGPGVVSTGGARFAGPATRVGIHTAQPGDIDVPVALLDGGESAIPSGVTGEGSSGAKTGGGAAPRELWRWFVYLAAVLLAVEWVVYGLRSRV